MKPIIANSLLIGFMGVVTAQWAVAIQILRREKQSKGKEI